MRPPTPPLNVDRGQRAILEKLGRFQTLPHREVARAKVLLLAADGEATAAIAAQLQVSPVSAVARRRRFVEEGIAKIEQIRTGGGRNPTTPAEKIDEIVRLTQGTAPAGEAHWSCRSMAQAAGVSAATVQRGWNARRLKPHLVKTFKVSIDPQYEDRHIDVVGL